MFDILETVDNWLEQKRPVALAIVTKTWGSAPRREGSKMAVTTDLAMTGSVSGGCVEGAVYLAGVQVLDSGQGQFRKSNFYSTNS